VLFRSGRARGAKKQPWGQPLSFPPTAQEQKALAGTLEPLDAGDVAALKAEVTRLLATGKYRDF
jgi:hypothetical protein